MTNPITPAELEELDRLYSSATPGVWSSYRNSFYWELQCDKGQLAYFCDSLYLYAPEGGGTTIGDVMAESNVKAAAAIHNAYPCLRAKIAELEAELEGIKLDLSAANARAEKAEEHVYELSQQLEFDRTAVAGCITEANAELDRRAWLTDGRGSYEWDDQRYQDEFLAAGIAIKAAISPLARIAANWAGCPKKGSEVAAARIDIKAELDAANARAEKAEKLERYYETLDIADELAAHCERLREHAGLLIHAARVVISNQFGRYLSEDTPITVRLLDGTVDAAEEALSATPAQSLAAIRAEALREFAADPAIASLIAPSAAQACRDEADRIEGANGSA